MDRVAALEIIEEVTTDLGALHREIVMALLHRKLNEKPNVGALLVKMGPDCAWEVDGYLDRDGHAHPVPVMDVDLPSAAVSATEDAWWDDVEGHIGVLWDIPVDGKTITEETTSRGTRLVIRPTGPARRTSAPAPEYSPDNPLGL